MTKKNGTPITEEEIYSILGHLNQSNLNSQTKLKCFRRQVIYDKLLSHDDKEKSDELVIQILQSPYIPIYSQSPIIQAIRHVYTRLIKSDNINKELIYNRLCNIIYNVRLSEFKDISTLLLKWVKHQDFRKKNIAKLRKIVKQYEQLS